MGRKGATKNFWTVVVLWDIQIFIHISAHTQTHTHTEMHARTHMYTVSRFMYMILYISTEYQYTDMWWHFEPCYLERKQIGPPRMPVVLLVIPNGFDVPGLPLWPLFLLGQISSTRIQQPVVSPEETPQPLTTKNHFYCLAGGCCRFFFWMFCFFWFHHPPNGCCNWQIFWQLIVMICWCVSRGESPKKVCFLMQPRKLT